jgi:hypothetical protein
MFLSNTKDLLSVRHMSWHAWLSLVKVQVRSNVLFTVVLIKSSVEPAKLRSNINLKVASERDRSYPDNGLFSWPSSLETIEVLRSMLKSCVRLVDHTIIAPMVGRSCQKNVAVSTTFITVSSKTSTIPESRVMPIRQCPSTRERSDTW